MIKNKKGIYLLICGVVSVWGIIGYRIYDGISKEVPVTATGGNKVKTSYFKLLDHSKDTYMLHADYRDPFLAINEFEPEKDNTEIVMRKIANPILPIAKPQINWLAILYTGYILNPQSKKRVGIFNINGREIMLSAGEESGGLKISKFVGDSVKVIYQNASRFISIK